MDNIDIFSADYKVSVYNGVRDQWSGSHPCYIPQ